MHCVTAWTRTRPLRWLRRRLQRREVWESGMGRSSSGSGTVASEFCSGIRNDSRDRVMVESREGVTQYSEASLATGLSSRVFRLWSRVSGYRPRVSGLYARVSGPRSRVQGLGLGCGGWGSGSRSLGSEVENTGVLALWSSVFGLWPLAENLGLRVSGLASRVLTEGPGTTIQRPEARVSDLLPARGRGSRVKSLGSEVENTGVLALWSSVVGLGSIRRSGVWGLGSRAQGLGSGLGSRMLGSRVQGIGTRVCGVECSGLWSTRMLESIMQNLRSSVTGLSLGSRVLGCRVQDVGARVECYSLESKVENTGVLALWSSVFGRGPGLLSGVYCLGSRVSGLLSRVSGLGSVC
eukprot:862710-Rhodomonas_salina.1